jgi:hypothetical protein
MSLTERPTVLKPRAIAASHSTDTSLQIAFVVVVAVVHYINSPELFFWRRLQTKGFAPLAAMLHHCARQRPEL